MPCNLSGRTRRYATRSSTVLRILSGIQLLLSNNATFLSFIRTRFVGSTLDPTTGQENFRVGIPRLGIKKWRGNETADQLSPIKKFNACARQVGAKSVRIECQQRHERGWGRAQKQNGRFRVGHGPATFRDAGNNRTFLDPVTDSALDADHRAQLLHRRRALVEAGFFFRQSV